jgi:tetratricopeptide (TPR) repeat protein
LFERGLAHKAMNDCFHAVGDFSAAVSGAPDVAPILLEKAQCLIDLDQPEEAARSVERALLAAPGTPRAFVLKGVIYEKGGFLARAEDEYSRALYYDPVYPAALDKRAGVLLKRGKPREALADLDLLVRIEPQRPDVLVSRARLNMKLRQYDRSLEDYSRAESLVGGDEAIVKEKVQALFKTGRPGSALADISRYAAQHPDDFEGQILQARAHILLKDFAKAEAILRAVFARIPSCAPCYLCSGLIARLGKDWDKALADLNRAVNLDPSSTEALKERGRVFIELDEPVRAAADLTAAAELDPSDGEIFALRGLTFLSRMLFDAAIQDFTHALECLPGDARILYDRAAAFVRKEDWTSALQDLDKIVSAKPRAARALALRGVVHFSRGKTGAAAVDFNRAVESDADDPLVWNNRGFFYYKTGDYAAAMSNFNKALQLNPEYEHARRNLSLALRKRERGSEPNSVAEAPLATE